MRRFTRAVLACFAAAGAWSAAAPASAQAPSTYTKTKHPIVLATGLGAPQFYQIKEALELGGADVCVAQVTPFDSTIPLPFLAPNGDVIVPANPPLTPTVGRGAELIGQIHACLQGLGIDPVANPDDYKVNLFGYSQGALDARFVLGVAPELVASVTSFAGPHRGSSEFIDALGAEGAVGCPFVPDPVADCPATLAFLSFAQVGVIADPSNPANGNVSNAGFFTSSGGLGLFNAPFLPFQQGLDNPTDAEGCDSGSDVDANGKTAAGIGLYSFGGDEVYTSTGPSGFDPTDDLLAQTESLLLQAPEDATDDSDGLVEVCSSHFGLVRRDDFAMNHLDFANQVNGLVKPGSGSNPSTMYREHANFLKNQGF